jgi:hypothetical protein
VSAVAAILGACRQRGRWRWRGWAASPGRGGRKNRSAHRKSAGDHRLGGRDAQLQRGLPCAAAVVVNARQQRAGLSTGASAGWAAVPGRVKTAPRTHRIASGHGFEPAARACQEKFYGLSECPELTRLINEPAARAAL